MRRLLTVLLLACSALLGVVAPAQAHNILIGSDPKDGARLSAGPERITLTFDQSARQGFAQISVTGPDGTRWEDGATTVNGPKVGVALKPLGPAGEYAVGYRILSSDGHPISGKITFTLTAAGPGAAASPQAVSSASPASPGAADSGASPASQGSATLGSPELSAQAAEAAQNGGAGMAVLWIGAALVLLGGATVVAMRRAGGREAQR
ncbi:copper resistance CopC family protein [Streptosporangium pseudovulgare]|uniref:Copper resistance protein C n=1 Tax=Streptosporangium pseudovulgare TaxID=35765 RepID=A0ABQ2QLS0_9ACTN|nr:copper resistance CopC family protein [Streptosporangium pseudovulgare]GGP84767.1 copper resistance protein C [Streptosporangium pseudovulgare]